MVSKEDKGVKVNGTFFNEDNSYLTLQELIDKIESVGLTYAKEYIDKASKEKKKYVKADVVIPDISESSRSKKIRKDNAEALRLLDRMMGKR